MKTIELTNGLFVLVDDDDYASLSVFTWRQSHWGYAKRMQRVGGKQKQIFMHRQILGLGSDDDMLADHRNGDRLDNRKSNLRACSRAENARNRPRQSNNTTGYKGVSKASASTFRAQIKVSGKKIYLGAFPTPEAAYAAYCEAAKQYHGEFFRPE